MQRTLFSPYWWKRLGKNYSYETIPLKLFVEIGSTGNVYLLGGFKIKKRWSKIVSDNAKALGNHEYEMFSGLLAKNNKYAVQYLIVQSSLNLLTVKSIKKERKFVSELIHDLAKYGYKIDTSSSENYLNSINAAKRKVLNLANRIGINKIQINTILGKASDVKPKTFDTLIAELNSRLGFVVSDTITLARFNEYNKVLEEKAKRANNGRNK